MKYLLFLLLASCAHSAFTSKPCSPDPTYDGRAPEYCIDKEGERLCVWADDDFYAIRHTCHGEWLPVTDDAHPI